MINKKDLINRIIRLIKLDITTFLTSLSPVMAVYLLGGFINKEIIGVFSFTYVFQFLWSTFNRGLNHSIFVYAFKDIKNEKDRTMSILFSGCIIFALIELAVYLLFIFYTKQYLILLKVSPKLIDICYIYTVYTITAIGLQLIDSITLSYYEYTNRLELNNKLGFIYAILRIGGVVIYGLINKYVLLNNSMRLIILNLPLISFTLIIFSKMLYEINKFKVHFTWEFFISVKYGVQDILNYILNAISSFIGTRSMNLAGTAVSANGSTAFQYAFITTITDIQWDCAYEENTLISLDIASEPIKYKHISQINDKRLNDILKLDIIAGYIILSIIFIIAFIILNILSSFLTITDYMLLNMFFNILGMIICIPNYVMSTLLNSLGRYKELSIISIIAVTIRVIISFIRSVYAINIGMIVSTILHFILITSLFLYYKHKYKVSKDS